MHIAVDCTCRMLLGAEAYLATLDSLIDHGSAATLTALRRASRGVWSPDSILRRSRARWSSSTPRWERSSAPVGRPIDPEARWHALPAVVVDAGELHGIEAISLAGQQLGMVALDENLT